MVTAIQEDRLPRATVLEAFNKSSSAIIEDARRKERSLTDYLDNWSIPNKDDELSALDWMLWKHDIECYDSGYTPSSALNKMGDWSNKDFDQKPVAKLFYEKIGDRYAKTMYRGLPHVELQLPPTIQRASLNTLSEIKPGTAMNLYDDSDFYRAKQFGPIIDYRQIIGMSESTTADAIRKNKYSNAPAERLMKITPEATSPARMELAYSEELVAFTAYGIAIEASYDFLMANQTRVSAIMNAVDEVAMQYRTTIFEQVVKTIKAARPAGNTVAGTELTLTNWLDFRKKFTHYSLDIVLGDNASITEWEKVVFGLNSQDITLAYLALLWSGMIAGGKSPMLLNNQPTIPNYGWYPDLEASLVPNELLAFDQMRSSKVWFRRNLDQDETKRDPENRVLTRYLNTQVAVDTPDPNGIYTLSIG